MEWQLAVPFSVSLNRQSLSLLNNKPWIHLGYQAKSSSTKCLFSKLCSKIFADYHYVRRWVSWYFFYCYLFQCFDFLKGFQSLINKLLVEIFSSSFDLVFVFVSLPLFIVFIVQTGAFMVNHIESYSPCNFIIHVSGNQVIEPLVVKFVNKFICERGEGRCIFNKKKKQCKKIIRTVRKTLRKIGMFCYLPS